MNDIVRTRGRCALVLVVLCAVGAGCSTTTETTDTTDTTETTGRTDTTQAPPATTIAPEPSAGCTAARPLADLTSAERHLDVDGTDRWYLASVPADSVASKPLPLVVDFHGLSEGAVVHTQMSEMGAFGPAHGFIALVPQGTSEPVRWAARLGGPAKATSPDLTFVARMLDEVEKVACVDTTRVYATGLSNGAMMTSLVACVMADRFAAVAPVAGVVAYDDCSPSEPVPMLTIHGTADEILQFNGGVGPDLSKILGPDAIEDSESTTTSSPLDLDGSGYPAAVRDWARRNLCDDTPRDTDVTQSIIHRTFDCPVGAPVEMYIVKGGGHSWPGSEFSRGVESMVGLTTFDIDANELIWEFFSRFQRPR